MEAATATREMTAPKKRRGLRKMTWAILAWSVIMGIWIVAGAGTAAQTTPEEARCIAEAKTNPFMSASDCSTFADAGTAIGVAALVFVWFFGFVILSIVWFMSKPRRVIVVREEMSSS